MKNVLFISPDTFGYYKTISAAISRRGLKPIWLNQLPATGIASRVLFRLVPGIARQLGDRHFARELEKIEQVDQILIIKGEGISEATIAAMRARFSDARIVYYLWDSIANVPGARRMIALCDTSYSFDPVDCEVTPDLNYLPLFHSGSFGTTAPRRGFATFIGTLHTNRYNKVREIGRNIEKINGITPFLYFYYPSRFILAVLRVVNKSFRNVRSSEVYFKPLPLERYVEIQSDAEIAIDICHPKQSGLTMRSIEAISGGKKLITNNKVVRRYEFYRPENCYVVEDEPYESFAAFLNSPFQPLPAEMIDKYHVDTWIARLLTTDNV